MIKWLNEKEIGPNKNFAYTIGGISFLAAYFISAQIIFTLALFLLGIFFISAGMYVPTIFKRINLVWCNFGYLLSLISNPIILGILYFLIITPLGMILQTLSNDPLSRRIMKDKKTYWNLRKTPIQPFNKQY